MRRLIAACALAAVMAAGCEKTPETAGLEVKPGSDVTLEKKDGVKIAGRLVEVKPEFVVVESRSGARTSVPRAEISSLSAANLTAQSPAPAAAADGTVGSTGRPAASTANPAAPAATPDPPRAPEYREVTIPAGTLLPLDLASSIGSDTSQVEDPVRATLRRAVVVGGVEALPAGATVLGNVTAVERSARVKGRARIAFRFTAVDPPGDAERLAIRTDTIARLAPATKKQDAAKIGGGAAGGALIGASVGGGDGAAKGAAIGGAAGTGVVLSTRGKEVRLGPGADLSARLAAPVTVRIRAR